VPGKGSFIAWTIWLAKASRHIARGDLDGSILEAITLELVKRGYTKNEIHKIWSGNILRVYNLFPDEP
jgi:hypothetical protein